MLQVAVLGCGPAGLIAAESAMRAALGQVNVQVFSRKVPSPLYGAQYLHRPIPGATRSAPRTVDYRLQGTEAGYRRKVYGQNWDGTVSPGEYGGLVQAWDIRETYRNLWDMWVEKIMDVTVEAGGMRTLINEFDLVISSIPKPTLCYTKDKDHHFHGQWITAAGDAPDLGIDLSKLFRCEDETVICNGNESPSWYRMSRIFGHTTIEWPHREDLRIPVSTAARVMKPISNDCDCWPEVEWVGRYGSWTKGVLSHEAWEQVRKRVELALDGVQL